MCVADIIMQNKLAQYRYFGTCHNSQQKQLTAQNKEYLNIDKIQVVPNDLLIHAIQAHACTLSATPDIV